MTDATISRTPIVEYVTCIACGTRMRGAGSPCLHCEAAVAAAVETPPARLELSKEHRLIAAAAGSILLLVGAALWEMKSPPAAMGAGAAGVPSALSPVSAASPPEPTAAPASSLPEPVTAADSVRFANASLSAGDLPAAKVRYEEALEKQPDDPEAQNGLGLVLERQGQLTDALDRYARAAALAASVWAYRFNLAHAAAALQQWDQAIADYREAARLFPTDYATVFNLALTLHKKGDDAAAIPEFQKAIELAPSEPSFHVSLALSLEKTGKLADADREYRTYLAMVPDAPDAEKIKTHLGAIR